MKLKFEGVYPPIITPFKENEEIDFQALQKNMEKWNQTGLSGYVVFGSNGEYTYLSEAEKLDLVRSCVEFASKHKKLIVGSGCESTRETIQLTNKCAQLGAHAALIITPYYYKNRMDRKALKKHFYSVAEFADIPILIYNVPKFTGINLDPDFIAELSEHPNIVGIKDSTGNITQLSLIGSQTSDDFSILVGTANVFYPGMMLGASGGIQALANCCPNECVKMYELFLSQKYLELKNLQLKLIPVNNAVTNTFGIPGLKEAMNILGFNGGYVRKPLLPLSELEKDKLREILRIAGLLP